MLNYYNVVLLVLGELGGSIKGRTLLQKIIYFLARAGLVEDTFKPHYYGPYSSRVYNSLLDLVSFGFLNEEEEIDNDNRKRFKYVFSSDGKKIYNEIKDKYHDEYEVIKKLISLIKKYDGLNYYVLATASKVDYLYKRGDVREFNKILAEIYWSISKEDIDNVMKLVDEINNYINSIRKNENN